LITWLLLAAAAVEHGMAAAAVQVVCSRVRTLWLQVET
jgi:hypothetical protein